ncbi:MAG: putative Ig domain-containing protein [Deltaproteobacteria bacterium]|nr:putative Ig domain-containing protein [Deltaproteobacteria bacterium]
MKRLACMIAAAAVLSTASSALAQTITEFTVPTASANPSHIILADDGKLWFTLPGINSIGRISPSATDGAQIEIIEASATASALPTGIAYDAASNLVWFTLRNTTRLATLPLTATTTTEPEEIDITTLSGCSGVSDPNEIVSGENGFIYFTLTNSNRIGRISIDKTSCQLFTPVSSDAQPTGIVLGADGNIWFTLFAANKIGRLKLSDGTIQEYPSSGNTSAGPNDIILGSDGNLWFTMLNANKIGRVNREDTSIDEFSVSGTGSQVRSITAGPDGTPLWFTLTNDNKIGQIAPSGTVKALSDVTTASSQPFDITLGPSNTLWFTEFAAAANKIAKIEPSDVLNITNDSSLTDGTKGEAYSVTLAAEDGTAPYTFALQSGSTLPEGLTLASSGVISGTPSVAKEEATQFVVTVTDAESVQNAKSFAIAVNQADLPDLSVVLNKIKIRGGVLRAKGRPRNIGTAAANNAGIAFFLSRNQAFEESKDKLIDSDIFPTIEAGEQPGAIVLKYRGKIARKFKFLIACMDSANSISEQVETNNCDFGKLPR